MPDLLTAFRTHLASKSCATRTIDTYTKIASSFLRSLPGRSPLRADAETFLARPRLDGVRRASTGRNQELAALRSLAAYAVEEKRWSENPTNGIEFVREVRRDPAFLDEEELRRLFLAAAREPPGGEVTLVLGILALLSQAGLRVRELVSLDLSQVDLAAGKLLGVRGKGGTVTSIDLNAPTIALLTLWIQQRAAKAPPGEAALFLSSRRGRLAVRTVENWFVKLRAAMGTAKKVTPHTLRHSFATLQLMQGTDLATVSSNMRHADINSTLWYLHLVDIRRKEAIRRLGSTVPREVLGAVQRTPFANVPYRTPATENVAVPAQPPATSCPTDLDDQYGMVAA